MPTLDWSKVEKTPGCWIWMGMRAKAGYGYISAQSKTYMVHRLSYEEHYGLISEGMVIDHLCGVKRCVNPQHLEAVVPGENAAYAVRQGETIKRRTLPPAQLGRPATGRTTRPITLRVALAEYALMEKAASHVCMSVGQFIAAHLHTCDDFRKICSDFSEK